MAERLVVDRGDGAGITEAGPVRWDGKPTTVERLRELMPACVTLVSGDYLQVKVLRKISPRRSVHDVRIVPFGWYLTSRNCRHGETFAVVTAPEAANA